MEDFTAMRCRISELLRVKGWSLSELSRRTRISKSTLSAFDTMTTKGTMTLRNAIVIAAALDCEPEDLYVWNNEEILRQR